MNRTALKRQLERHEGRRARPYEDTEGVLTIGVGRNLTRGLSLTEIDLLLDNDIRSAMADTEKAVNTFHTLSPLRQQVLVNMMFNLGSRRFRGFKRMLAAIDKGNFPRAADEMMDSKWARQVHARATELAYDMRRG